MKIKVNPRLGQVKILMIGEASSWEQVLQSSGLCEETVQEELTSHQWNIRGINVVHYNMCRIASFSHEG